MPDINNPFLHLPLNEIHYDPESKKKISPIVGEKGHAVVHGDPIIGYDPKMGSCMLFNGEKDNFLLVEDIGELTDKGGFSIAVWVRFDKVNADSGICYIRNIHEHYYPRFCLNRKEETNLHFSKDKWDINPSWEEIITEKTLSSNTWQHIAVIYGANNTSKIVINGVLQESKDLIRNEEETYQRFFIGYAQGSFFKGAMAHFRLYNYALEESHIKEVMKKDKSSMAAFRETAPLKLELYTVRDDNHLPIIYVESENKSEPLELHISNPSGKEISFEQFENPSEKDFHFQLRFRKNVIAPNVLSALNDAADKTLGDWNYSVIPSTEGREDWISFVHNGGADFILDKGASTILQLPQFSAAAQGGARNTRVEVRFHIKDQEIGSIIRHLEIQSHLGLKVVPLVPQITGSNTILNDGHTKNKLTIEILYTKPIGSVLLNNEEGKPSRFELIVDENLINGYVYNKPEDKTKEINAKILDVHLDRSVDRGITHKTFTFKVNESGVSIANIEKKDKSIEKKIIKIEIDNWITNGESGIHNLLLRYENIHGYWDGMWVLPVQFGPMVVRNVSNEERIGIGTDNPQAELHVVGKTLIEKGALTVVENTILKRELTVSGDTIISSKLTVDKDIETKSKLTVKENTELKRELTVSGDTKLKSNLKVEGRIQDKTGDVMPVGSIIAYAGSDPPEGWLICNGQNVDRKKHPELYKILHHRAFCYTPDLRSRFIVGMHRKEDKKSVGMAENRLKPYPLHDTGGVEEHALTMKEMPRHQHFGVGEHWTDAEVKKNAELKILDHWPFGRDESRGKNFIGFNGQEDDDNLLHGTTHTGGDPEKYFDAEGKLDIKKANDYDELGATVPHENLPPYYALTYIIKF